MSHSTPFEKRRRFLQKLAQRPLAPYLRLVLDREWQRICTGVWTAMFRLSCRLHGVRVGGRVEVFGRVIVRSPAGKIVIGDRVQLISSAWRSSAAAVSPVRLRTFMPSAAIIIEDQCAVNGGSITARSRTVRLGKGTQLGPDCLITDSDFHVPWPPEMRNSYVAPERDGDIRIGQNVWFGARCIVLKGVTIGDNSVIAAGSVVVESIPQNALAAGNPARVMKTYDGASSLQDRY